MEHQVWWTQPGQRYLIWVSQFVWGTSVAAQGPIRAARMPADVFAPGFDCNPALMKVMVFLEGWKGFAHTTRTAMASAMPSGQDHVSAYAFPLSAT